ncbi:hypothetical protein Syun_014169 [Stephania yunnanensis]|uniref:AB hydrolase-1 domain-containing protein n=1 Tax=Stephania yunnanensis TaxID=152371 RepID=A0AAP0JJ89_9MAGN
MEVECVYPAHSSPYYLLLQSLLLIPISHYLLAISLVFLTFLYNFVEFHFFEDLLNGFRGDSVSLTYNPGSDVYEGVASKCPSLHGRYLATPWLSSPHLQTAFLNFFGNAPVLSYKRQLFHAQDGGTIALDWLMASDVFGDASSMSRSNTKDYTTPIVVVIPGLTSDSASPYVKHLVFKIAKHGWNVVLSNHRGLGGISMTSDCFYNAGWTMDVREVVEYLHQKYPKAPLYAVGTSIGANVLVKYLGEVGDDTHFVGAAAICSPWDLLICDRFISRRLVQRLYDKALAIGLKGYAQLHKTILSRLADWEGISKSRSVRDFDNYATRVIGKFETVDTYYRHCSSASFVGNVSIPLLCISALDDPVCTKEAIPWDECRANKNIVLATTRHGGHLAFFEGITASHLWWLNPVHEFLSVLHGNSFVRNRKKKIHNSISLTREHSIDQGPFVSFTEDGMVSAMGNEETSSVIENICHDQNIPESGVEITLEKDIRGLTEQNSETQVGSVDSSHQSAKDATSSINGSKNQNGITSHLRRSMDQVLRHNRISLWLLAYIAITTTWPFLGSAIIMSFKKKFRNIFSGAGLRR